MGLIISNIVILVASYFATDWVLKTLFNKNGERRYIVGLSKTNNTDKVSTSGEPEFITKLVVSALGRDRYYLYSVNLFTYKIWNARFYKIAQYLAVKYGDEIS